jgi:hypothetical protein
LIHGAFPPGCFLSSLAHNRAAHVPICRADGTCDSKAKINFQIEIVPADGTGAAKQSKRRLRYVAVFEQLSGKSLLTISIYVGCPDQNTTAPTQLKRLRILLKRLGMLRSFGKYEIPGIASPLMAADHFSAMRVETP